MNSTPSAPHTWSATGRAAAALFAVLLAGCATTGSSAPATVPAEPPTSGAPAPAGAASDSWQMPNDIHWVRNAAEKRAIYEMVYARATEAVESFVEARGASELAGGSTDAASGAGAEAEARPWAVILDADETVLDNSTYQVERSRQGLGYSSESWNDWVRRREASVLPGAMAFMQRVKSLGGHVAIVTNRDISVCTETEENLTTEGVPFDVVLCRGPETREKEVRFEMVQEGTTHTDLPPLDVLVWVGDNIEDFPGGTQRLHGASAAAFANFGRRFFVLPNPMYGSWEGNPQN